MKIPDLFTLVKTGNHEGNVAHNAERLVMEQRHKSVCCYRSKGTFIYKYFPILTSVRKVTDPELGTNVTRIIVKGERTNRDACRDELEKEFPDEDFIFWITPAKG